MLEDELSMNVLFRQACRLLEDNRVQSREACARYILCAKLGCSALKTVRCPPHHIWCPSGGSQGYPLTNRVENSNKM
uniref:Uncharacterized protein n=1 Tax=Romanomermis culicivorax TaxID=13658 RepID=A0A915KA10_ROMCU